MTNEDLKCLRCSVQMEEGRIGSVDTPSPFYWTTFLPRRKGPFIVLGWGKWAKPYRDANARIKSSQIEVKNYRCPKCGYIELNAKRDAS